MDLQLYAFEDKDGAVMRLTNTLAEHLGHPDVSYRDYANLSVLKLGQSIAPLRKIYLDTKFWVDLRDTKSGRKKNADLQSLLELLTSP